MYTQLEDIASQVAKEHMSDRLRNNEIRSKMTDSWSAPTETSPTQPTSLIDTTKTVNGTSPTLASTYSGMKNNWDVLGLNTSSGGTTPSTSVSGDSSGSWKTQGWAPTVTGTAMSLAGAGPYAGLGAAATNAMQGNYAGATGNIAASLASALGANKIPGLAGMFGTLTSGIMGDKSPTDIGMGLVNSGLGTLVGMANPIAGAAYSLARAIGFNPAYGLNNLFGNGMQGVAPGFGGTAGGFFGNNALGGGMASTINTTPYTSSSGNTAGYSPPGYTTTDRGTGITTGGGAGLSGGISNSFSGTTYGGYSPSAPATNNNGYSGYSYSGPGSPGAGAGSDGGDSGGGD